MQLSGFQLVLIGYVLPKDPLPAHPRLAGSVSHGVQTWAQQRAWKAQAPNHV